VDSKPLRPAYLFLWLGSCSTQSAKTPSSGNEPEDYVTHGSWPPVNVCNKRVINRWQGEPFGLAVLGLTTSWMSAPGKSWEHGFLVQPGTNTSVAPGKLVQIAGYLLCHPAITPTWYPVTVRSSDLVGGQTSSAVCHPTNGFLPNYSITLEPRFTGESPR